jgi:hypothetical protein
MKIGVGGGMYGGLRGCGRLLARSAISSLHGQGLWCTWSGLALAFPRQSPPAGCFGLCSSDNYAFLLTTSTAIAVLAAEEAPDLPAATSLATSITALQVFWPRWSPSLRPTSKSLDCFCTNNPRFRRNRLAFLSEHCFASASFCQKAQKLELGRCMNNSNFSVSVGALDPCKTMTHIFAVKQSLHKNFPVICDRWES